MSHESYIGVLIFLFKLRDRSESFVARAIEELCNESEVAFEGELRTTMAMETKSVTGLHPHMMDSRRKKIDSRHLASAGVLKSLDVFAAIADEAECEVNLSAAEKKIQKEKSALEDVKEEDVEIAEAAPCSSRGRTAAADILDTSSGLVSQFGCVTRGQLRQDAQAKQKAERARLAEERKAEIAKRKGQSAAGSAKTGAAEETAKELDDEAMDLISQCSYDEGLKTVDEKKLSSLASKFSKRTRRSSSSRAARAPREQIKDLSEQLNELKVIKGKQPTTMTIGVAILIQSYFLYYKVINY